MNLLLDFIEMEFGLLPVESPGETITFLPPFVALVGTALWDTSIWVSLYGDEYEFDGKDTEKGKFRHWRRFHVQNRDKDIVRAKELILKACENYKRSQGNIEWEYLIIASEQRWLERRSQEIRDAERARLIREL